MRLFAYFGSLTFLALILVACAADAPSPDPTAMSPTATPDAPAPDPAPDVLLPVEEPPPGTALFATDFDKHSVPYSEIRAGGPGKDGIPAIDEPRFVTVGEAGDWLEAQESLILVQVGDDARAYPLQVLMWHEIVNDTVGGMPVAVTFCPLCNTAIVYQRTFDGLMLDFGATGRLRYSNMVMYDRQTETWWQQATGEGIVGEFTGRQLAFIPAPIISWADFETAHPEGMVLSRQTGHDREYGRNPYVGYDDVDRSPFLYDGPMTPDVLLPMARVLAVDPSANSGQALGKEAVAYPYDVLRTARVVNDDVAGAPIVVLWFPGTASALDANRVADGDDVGAATAFSRELDGRTLTFALNDGRVVDEQTDSEWNVLGQAIAGPLAGQRLTSVVAINYFWFSWAAFRPGTGVYFGDPSTIPESGSVELESDFEIVVYQGRDVLGGVLQCGPGLVRGDGSGIVPVWSDVVNVALSGSGGSRRGRHKEARQQGQEEENSSGFYRPSSSMLLN